MPADGRWKLTRRLKGSGARHYGNFSRMFFIFATEFKLFYSYSCSRKIAITILHLIQETHFRTYICTDVIEEETAEM